MRLASLELAVGLVLVGALLGYLGVPYSGVLVVFGVVLFLWWLFTEGARRFDGR
jgi:hypothetical protein